MHDLVIKGGTIVDGTGRPQFTGDIAISDGVITEVGKVDGEARDVIDAGGLLVAPGFVDIHTHYDGQVSWDYTLAPSTYHGVTTVVMGNCGVGFAPTAPDRRDWVIGLMEGVEDIPGSALAEGIQWNWESFPQFLDYLDKLPLMIDVGTQVPHAAVRAYVMGERGARHEPANPEDILEMAQIVKEGVQAGALGFSTGRTIVHRAVDGEPIPGTFAAQDELLGIAKAMAELGKGMIEWVPAGVIGEDLAAPEKEIAMMRRIAQESGRPILHTVLQHDAAPELWRELLDRTTDAQKEGVPLTAQVASRCFGLLLTLASRHPFMTAPSFQPIADLPLAEKVARLRDPELREKLLAEADAIDPMMSFMRFDKIFPMQDPPNYEPAPETSIAAIARREGRSPFAVFYDLMLEHEGKQVFLSPSLNYSHFNLDTVYEMLTHPSAVSSLSDGGAHCSVVCDASMPTTLISYWTRDREQGPKLPLELAVKKQTHDTARLYGLRDRGTIEPGKLADLNLIDYPRLNTRMPEFVQDLPAGGKRFIQRAEGYVATLKRGEVIMRNGEPTGARPGKLIRGEQG